MNSLEEEKRSQETDSQQQVRFEKDKHSKKKRSGEADIERQVRLEKDKHSKKQKRSAETDVERQMRLDKDKHSKKQNQATKVSQSKHKINQEDYVNKFDHTTYDGIEEQCWAKDNMDKFHKSVVHIVSQCTICGGIVLEIK